MKREDLDFGDFAAMIIILTVRYQIPLKAVIYRFYEEHHIDNIDKFIENYDFIKQILKKINIFRKSVKILYGTENDYILPYSSTYQDMEKAFVTGNASKENILEDAVKLELDMNVIYDFLAEEDDVEDDDDDDELFSIINAKRG